MQRRKGRKEECLNFARFAPLRETTVQKLNRACNSTTRPASALCARPKSRLSIVGEKNSNGARFRLLKALKKFAFTSRNVPSPKNDGIPVRFARLKSTAKYLGPRNELRPMPGGNSPIGLFASK